MRRFCVFCGIVGSSSPRQNKYPDDYDFICRVCRESPAPDEYRCIAKNSKKDRCGHFKTYKSNKCAIHSKDTAD